MAGISRLAALIIQTNDEKDITADAAGQHDNGKYAGWITFWKYGRPHISPLISTEPIYDTAEQAEEAMQEIVAKIRAIDVLADLKEKSVEDPR